MKSRATIFLIAIVWLSLMTFLLCLPGKEFPKASWTDKYLIDKWIHVLLFIILVIVWCWLFQTKKAFAWIVIASILYGIAIEFIQHYFVPNRGFEYGDIAADIAGSVGGYFIAVRRYIKK